MHSAAWWALRAWPVGPARGEGFLERAALGGGKGLSGPQLYLGGGAGQGRRRHRQASKSETKSWRVNEKGGWVRSARRAACRGRACAAGSRRAGCLARPHWAQQPRSNGSGGGRLQLMSGKMFQWQRLFKRKPEWGDRGFRSRWEAGPIPKIGEFHEHLKTNPRP